MKKDSIERYANFEFKFYYRDKNDDNVVISVCNSDLYFDMKFYEDNMGKSYVDFETRVIPRSILSDEGLYVLNKTFPFKEIVYYSDDDDLRTKCKNILSYIGRGTVFFNLSEKLIQEFDIALDRIIRKY